MYNMHQRNYEKPQWVLMVITFILNFITIVVVASPNAFAEYQEIYNKTHMLQLKSDNRTIKTERITTVGELDAGENKFRFTFYTKDFDKQDWSKEEKRIPLHIRHTNTAPQYMGIIIFHSENVKVLESKQKGFLVRDSMFSKKYGWEELLPYKDHRNAQIAMGVGEKVIDKLLTTIPFAKEGYKQLVEYCAKQNKRYYESIFKEKENYVATMLPLHIPKDIIGFTETARSIEIPFDLSAAQGEQKMSFWINPAFGNPSVSYSEGTHTMGFGRLGGITIGFALSQCQLWDIEDIVWYKKVPNPHGREAGIRPKRARSTAFAHPKGLTDLKSLNIGMMYENIYRINIQEKRALTRDEEICPLGIYRYLYTEDLRRFDNVAEFNINYGTKGDQRIIDLTCDAKFKEMFDKYDLAFLGANKDGHKEFLSSTWKKLFNGLYKRRFAEPKNFWTAHIYLRPKKPIFPDNTEGRQLMYKLVINDRKMLRR